MEANLNAIAPISIGFALPNEEALMDLARLPIASYNYDARERYGNKDSHDYPPRQRVAERVARVGGDRFPVNEVFPEDRAEVSNAERGVRGVIVQSEAARNQLMELMNAHGVITTETEDIDGTPLNQFIRVDEHSMMAMRMADNDADEKVDE